MKKSGSEFAIFLEDEDETLRLGQNLAKLFMSLGRYPALFFSGPLGAGKTTMIRGIVKNLPGGRDAQVSSPSFNILNIYPTQPETAHFDLHRLEGMGLDPESEDILLDEDRFILVEWSEFLPDNLWPADIMRVNICIQGRGRTAVVSFPDRSMKGLMTCCQDHDPKILPY